MPMKLDVHLVCCPKIAEAKLFAKKKKGLKQFPKVLATNGTPTLYQNFDNTESCY